MSWLIGSVNLLLTHSSDERLETLRSKLAVNSQSLIDLFRERATIAREIGDIKKELGLPPRIREREEAVMNSLRDLDSVSRSIISSLFEFSIVNETSSPANGHPSHTGRDRMKITGPTKDLEFLAGLIVSRPGVEVYSDATLPDSIERGFQLNGAHIIHASHPVSDITICLLEDSKDCDIFVSRSDEMHIKQNLSKPFSGTIVKVRA